MVKCSVRLLILLAVVCGCGRINFDPLVPDTEGTQDSGLAPRPDGAAVDAMVGASSNIVADGARYGFTTQGADLGSTFAVTCDDPVVVVVLSREAQTQGNLVTVNQQLLTPLVSTPTDRPSVAVFAVALQGVTSVSYNVSGLDDTITVAGVITLCNAADFQVALSGETSSSETLSPSTPGMSSNDLGILALASKPGTRAVPAPHYYAHHIVKDFAGSAFLLAYPGTRDITFDSPATHVWATIRVCEQSCQ